MRPPSPFSATAQQRAMFILPTSVPILTQNAAAMAKGR
jgi:hypothetical protein